MVHFENHTPLRKLCESAAKSRGINLKDKVYADRLKRELDLIAEKKFEDYFYLVHDIIMYAKQHMLVGPARGSSCGSIVCYLLSITEIDPIPYDLLFERFIDVNRKDLPDIDIDFPDDRRDMVFEYVHNKYGKDCVARLGTSSATKPSPPSPKLPSSCPSPSGK
jgi:DNA polymerase-3 subunit alpha